MTNKKETLIEALHGRLNQYAEIESMLEGVNIYSDDGHIDTELMYEILRFVADAQCVNSRVVSKLQDILGGDDNAYLASNKADNDGPHYEPSYILRRCTLQNNIIKLPHMKLSKKSYKEVKGWIEEAGGSWKGGRTQGFVFPFDATRVFSILRDGKRCNLQKDYQYFGTPPEVADRLVELANIEDNYRILEPSAGQGAIVDAIQRKIPGKVVQCYELMPENREILLKNPHVDLLGEDFMEKYNKLAGLFDRIIANPPFANNQDIRHLMAMYDLLAPCGRLVCMTSAHWEMAGEKQCAEFRDWLKHKMETGNAYVEDVPEGAFKVSGTMIRTKIVVIGKD